MVDTSSSAPASASPAITTSAAATTPVVILVVGMAGTGKTTLVHRMQHYAHTNGIRSYFINLDPAVTHTPYNVNIDIRDSVRYGEVMKNYRLGPNGAIMTSLNLFATKIHQVVSLLEKKEEMLDWIIVDTPGQIEVFTWSASGQLMADSFGAVFPTVLLFVADTVRCVSSPQTFVSTMLYSSGIMLKQQVPLVVVFNKTDVVSADSVIAWMRDNDALDEAVTNPHRSNRSRRAVSGEPGDGEDADWRGEGTRIGAAALGSQDALLANQGSGYAGTLAQSMSLFLHEFYEDLPYAAVSAASGAGMSELAASIERGKQQALEAKAERSAH
ncbi:putative XPA-interacting protein [Leishmania major strain Friedlin]|uniref:GPN-loop GTPase n=1 Tax=Leishmania major TaxID=5664 RepID=Q4QG26_LEIMA|nr:putative XPA-interacting protein [Leishmania major strain Friedlin]CAG9571113.1 XPA-interacting_protein_-_putative [Leishmania major strain Friedlin]CAJ03071.1 putative XPA-interacting protein [Leishmania major strain Friedlin]|eukprot:XP_001681872.1 putative XPA-interacting protein [Leishmania major strain Friedlin]